MVTTIIIIITPHDRITHYSINRLFRAIYIVLYIYIYIYIVGGIYSSHMIMLAPLPISCNVGVASGCRFFVELSGWPPTLQCMGEGAHNHEGRISSAYRLDFQCSSLS